MALSAGQTARVDATLEVGSLTESVEVTATSAVLQTENAVVGAKLDRDQVEKLPDPGPQPVDGDAVHDRRDDAESRRRSTA